MSLVDPYATTNALFSDNFAKMQETLGRRAAGNALAGGNTQGAIAALGGVGDLQSVQALREARQAQEQRTRAQGYGGQLAQGDARGAANAAFGAGDLEQGMKFAEMAQGMDAAQLKEAEERSDMIASIAAPFLQLPVDQRPAARDAIRPQLRAFGLDDAAIDALDLSDIGLQTIVAQAMGAKDYMANLARERAAEEQAKYRDAQLGLQRERVDISRQVASRPRQWEQESGDWEYF